MQWNQTMSQGLKPNLNNTHHLSNILMGTLNVMIIYVKLSKTIVECLSKTTSATTLMVHNVGDIAQPRQLASTTSIDIINIIVSLSLCKLTLSWEVHPNQLYTPLPRLVYLYIKFKFGALGRRCVGNIPTKEISVVMYYLGQKVAIWWLVWPCLAVESYTMAFIV